MNPEDVKAKLVKVLQEIQCDSGFKEMPIVGTTRPVTDLEGFDSPLWLDAIGMVAASLNINIPNHTNIFLAEDGSKQPLTIDESVTKICEIVQKGNS